LSALRQPRPSAVAAAVLLAVVWTAAPAAALDFPPLTGRVVDNADILSAADERRITEQLARHEADTSNQVVVVTLPSLQNTTIEDFGYQLGRHWGIGQAGRDNGALLIVAPVERKVRIEVGYGLEGSLPDATAKLIIERHILPAFREGDLPGGISAGVDTILAAIEGTFEPLPPRRSLRDRYGPMITYIVFFLVAVLVVYSEQRVPATPPTARRRRRRSNKDDDDTTDWFFGSSGGGGFGGGGGGFSGGGGGFGGGGSSGSW